MTLRGIPLICIALAGCVCADAQTVVRVRKTADSTNAGQRTISWEVFDSAAPSTVICSGTETGVASEWTNRTVRSLLRTRMEECVEQQGWSHPSETGQASAPQPHAHAISDTTSLQSALDGKAASSHDHDAAGIVSGVLAPARLCSGTPSSSNFCRGDGQWAIPSGGSDPWTYVKLTSDFVTSSATAVDVTGLAFTPSANTTYEIEGILLLRTATATVGPRPGVAWPSGMTDGVGRVMFITSATAVIWSLGNVNAALLVAVGGLPTTTQSYPSEIKGNYIDDSRTCNRHGFIRSHGQRVQADS